jgi:hypothetical protein
LLQKNYGHIFNELGPTHEKDLTMTDKLLIYIATVTGFAFHSNSTKTHSIYNLNTSECAHSESLKQCNLSGSETAS